MTEKTPNKQTTKPKQNQISNKQNKRKRKEPKFQNSTVSA